MNSLRKKDTTFKKKTKSSSLKDREGLKKL